MKTTFLVSAAALLGALSLAGVAHAQDTSGQQSAQSASASTSDSTSTAGYGGVSANSASGVRNSGWANCGHLPQCNADSGH